MDSIRLLESEGTEWFCRHGKTEGEIILDMDSTEDPTYGASDSKVVADADSRTVVAVGAKPQVPEIKRGK